MASLVKVITDYFDNVASMLNKGEKTASGTTDDKTPEEPSQVEGLSFISDDGHQTGNVLFSGAAKVPAERIAVGDMYDISQSLSRLGAIYNKKRSDYYDQAKKDLDTRKNRIAAKQLMAATQAKLAEAVKKAQTVE